ncbi:MAG: hypothetical protein QOG73_311, partial [Acetobacteraceae bacterium]|nr:hypothetical protein [Acetobacteraceae bacterium]
QPQQCRLTAAGRAEQRDEIGFGQPQGGVTQRFNAAGKAATDVTGSQHARLVNFGLRREPD